MPRTASEFIEWLVERHPALALIRDEHLVTFGELLPHVFFGDVTRYASSLARDGTDVEHLDRLLSDLDHSLSGGDRGDEVDSLVWASFVENVQGASDDSEEALRERLRAFPSLAQALSHYE